MKLTRHSRLVIFSILIFVILAMVISQSGTVRASVSSVYAFIVVARVETEIMQKTPAGLYYEGLFWKHNDEVMRITYEHPENIDRLRESLLLFIPGLEALVNEKGDTITITADQVDGLKEQLDWYYSWGSPVLKEDIEKERQRLNLDHFIGLTMNEALEYVNTTWEPESIIEKMIIPDSNGQWAYFVLNDVYFEYPSQYLVQVSESEPDFVYFFPSADIPEQWRPCVVKAKVWTILPTDTEDVHSWYAQENILWEAPVRSATFYGFEFIKGRSPRLGTNLHAFMYNQQNRLAVEIQVFIYESPILGVNVNYPQLVNENYEYFQHMIENLKIYNP